MSNIDDIHQSFSGVKTASWEHEDPISAPSLHVTRSGLYGRIGKRVVDISLVLIALPVVLPFLVVLAFLVTRDGGSPFFGHRRIGKNNRSFRCWKLRTMVPQAESRLKEYLAENPAAQQEWAATFKLTDDPRVTRLGRFLRRSSLDELPQLWNIFKGEMSIVGPRPVTQDELAMYGPALPYYESLRPGLTGLWQVSGRNDISYSDRVLLDVEYARSFNILLDMKIILGTVGAVLDRTGK